MTRVDSYLREVDARLVGVDRRVREDIVRELRGHLADAVEANGGNRAAALVEMGPAREVARRYKDLYGYGRLVKVVFGIVAVLLAVPTLPVLAAFTEDTRIPDLLAVPAVAVLAVYLIWVSVRAGSRVGLLAGLAAAAGRTAVLGILVVLESALVTTTPDGLAAFAAVGAALLILGWLPGTARRRWRPGGAEL